MANAGTNLIDIKRTGNYVCSGQVVMTNTAGNAGIARAVPDRLARDLLDPQGDRQSRIRRSGLGDSRNERGYRQRGNDDETPHLRLPQ